ncbi:MAG: alanine--tRNA ligase, partial [Candidatus Aenigmatarchaeota archaeon]
MNAKELKKRYIEFFKERGHKIIEQGPLIPENDPTVLFTTAGMHPLIPFLLGQKHPSGKRLVNVQRCLRTDDIMDVGDAFHNTFFEMLGNWSLGDYFKKEAIEWAYEFLTQHLKIDPKRINVTVFAGDKDAPCDSESIEIWMNLGIPRTRIFLNPKKDNWWGPVGETGPCGPDTEIFYDTGKDRCSEGCRPGCKCGKYFELWNLVFMEYNKMKNGKYEKLKQRNVDTGMGVERTTAILEGKDNVYDTELFFPLIKKIRESSKKIDTKAERIIADHIRAAVFIINDGVIPSNIEQGYVLRRLIRRAIRFCRQIESKPNLMIDLANLVIEIYKDDYPELLKNKDFILNELRNEEKRFKKTLEIGLLRFERLKPVNNTITGKDAFLLFQSFGFPIEITKELAAERNWGVDEKGFEEEYKKHQELSKKSIGGIFRSGLQDHSEISKRYHTATH